MANMGRRISLGAGILCLGLLAGWVDWTPQVDPNFFFSSSDPQLQAQLQISKMFPESTQIILSAKGELASPSYQKKIRELTEALSSLPGILSVYSLSNGPRGLEDTMKSPFWKRILIAEEGKASNLFVFAEYPLHKELVSRTQAIQAEFHSPDFQLILSGVPYITEMIQRNLSRDLRVFGVASLLIFGVGIWFLFHSLRMVLGIVVACVIGVGITMSITQLLDVKIGLLTANLTTILFVLTIEHILFLTFNWEYVVFHAKPDSDPNPLEALRRTWNPAFWSMLTTLLGFLSLLSAKAVPLQTMGISGAIGTAVTFLSVFTSYIWFFPSRESMQKAHTESSREFKRRGREFFSRPYRKFVVAGFLICGIAAIGLWRINTDPSLLAYFSQRSELGVGLTYIDHNLGSSPLQVVVRDPEGKKLNNTQAYHKLWDLQNALERDPAVGTAISLPIIMAEAKRTPVISILPWEWLFELMEFSSYRPIAKQFVTEDRQHGSFLLMMKESNRGRESRLEVIDRITGIVRASGFKPELIGGVYALQGRLSRLVTVSLLYGLGILLLLFAGMAWWLSRSPWSALGVLVSLALIPVGMLGVTGLANIPFDIISSPGVNIAIGMGVDAMIHLLIWVRGHPARQTAQWESWTEARVWLWQPILYTAIVTGTGFGIFGLSAFPPTQRFGLSIVLGTTLAPLSALFVLPLVATRFRAQ